MNTILKLQLGSIRVSYQKSIVNIEHQYNTLFYTNLHNFVTRQCIQHIEKELEMIKFIGASQKIMVASLEQHMGYRVCVNLLISKYKTILFL